MSEFNVDEYFTNRSKAFKTPDGSDFINDRYLELQRTSQDKVRELTERSSLAAQQEAADQESWVGKQGLDSKGFQGKAVNDAANLYQGTMRVAGSVLSAVPSALAAANQANLSEDDIAALERHQKGQSTPEDLARINRKVAPIVAPTPGMPRELAQAHANERAQAMADLNPNAPTPLSIWAEMNKSREISRTIVEAADRSSVVHKGAQTAFGTDLTNTYNDNAPQIAKGWEDLKAGSKLGGSADIAVGVAKLLFGGISDVASNPQATFEYMVQNAPQLLVGLAGKAGATAQLVDNVSSASDHYNKGIQDYQAKNGGALPPEDQRQYMAFMAATHAAAEQVGDKIGLAATKLGGEVVKDISKASFKAALKGTATAVGEGVLSEAPTEAFQQFAEGEIAGKPATGAEIFSAGVIGGASGAGLSGGGRAVHEAAKLASQPSEAKQETIDQAKVQAAAIASGDVSSIKDPVNQIAALFGHSQKTDTTQEQKQTNLAKASEIVAGLEAQHETIQQETKTSTVAGVKELIAERQAQLADPETAKEPAKVALLTQSLDLAQADLADLEASKDQKVVETAVQKKLADITQQLQEAKTAKDNLAVLVQSKDTIDADIALISAPKEANDALAAGVAPRATAAVGVSKEQTAAADRIITLAMTAPERLDTKVVAALAADTNNALTVPQRAYLSAFLRAQQSNPTLTSSHVAKDIYKGEYGNKGVLQFRNAMGKALAAGNQKMADAELTGKFGIFNFVQAHQNKADVAAQAIERGVGTSILKENGQWVVGAPGVEVTPEQHKAGGRTITSERLALAIKEEAQALADVAAELQAAYDLKFSAPAKVVDKAKPAPVVVASTEKVAEVTATQAEYDEAVRVSESTEKTTTTEETPVSSVNAEVTQSTESTKEEGKSTAEVTQPAGTLEALATKSPEGTPFNERELLADNFKQSAGKALVDVKNFLSTLVATASEQHPAVQSFIKHAQAWNKTITLNLPKVGERRFRYEDMMRFLITDTDGVSDIEENVKTAISYAVYQYVASEATSPQYHKDSAINSILGRQKDEWVSPSARETLAHVGMGQDRLIDSLGGAIMDVLGFKANDDAGQELASKLRAALGAHALKLMEDRKLVQGYVVSGPDMQKLREEGLDDHGLQRLSKAMGTANTMVAVTFFAIARNTEAGNDTAGKVTARVERIYQDTRGSQDALGKLFKAEPSTKIPSLVPVTDVAKVTAGTNQGVPDEQRDALEVMQSREHFVREDALDLLSEFGEEFLHSMMGVVEEENATVHRANRISVKAKNDGLRREWANFQEYVGEYLATSEKRLKTPFFFKFSPWKQQRTGIDNTAVNPQTSKIARALVTSARWESEIALDNKELMDSFYLGVAEGLGVKTERQDNQLSVDAIIDTLATPIYADAVAAIRKRMIHKESLSDQEKDAVLLAVAKGGANLHSLDALIGMAYHAEAVATKATTFVSRVYREVDGVANGTMLNHALLGAAENPEALAAILEHGGFFEEGSQYTHYSTYRGTQGNKDIYEKTGQMVYEEVMAAVGGTDSLVISSIWAIGGELFDPKTGIVSKAGRNLVKDGMNPLSFGSALEGVVKGMADTFADSVYTGFEKLAAKQALPDEINDYVMSVNVLLDKKHHIPMNKPMQWHMENVFSNQARTNITNSFSSTVGQITSAVLEREFAVFLERRNALNGTAQTVSGMYDALYRGIREDYVNQLIASGDIVAEHGADRTADLSKEQEAELTKKLSFVAPVLRTAMSKNDRKGNGTRTGLLMAKTRRKMSNDPAYKNVSKFGTPFADRATSDTRYSTARKAKSLTLRGFSKQYETIGVAIGSAATHSTDSRIMLMVQKMLDVLGIHDAAIDGVAGAKETANLLNSNTWESLLNYSPLEEVYLSTANMIQGMAQIIQNGDMPPQSITYLKEFLAKEQWKYGKGVNVLGAILNGAKQVAHQADTVKLGFMSTAGVIDQYAFQGGQYQVTQTNRDEAAQNLKELSDKIPKKISDALVVVQAALKAKPVVVPRPNSPVEEATAPTAETDEEGQFDVVGEQLDELPKGPATSPFGVVGKPTTKSDPALVKFFKENPKATAKQTIKFLYDKLTADKGAVNRDFNLKLLKLLLKTVPAGLTVNLVTKDTKAEDVYGMPSSPALGWYPAGAQEEVVYIVGTDFTQSNMQVEVLLHELTHAATSYRLFATAGAAQRKELSDLLDTVSKYTEANGITKFDAALTDVDELVAYGMTSPAFQKLLAQIPVGQSTNKVSDALQKFVGILANLLGFKQTSDAKALGVLLTNVAALMEQGANEKTELEGRTLSMAAPTNTYSTIDIHEALADGYLTEEFDEHLRRLLGGIVYNLHGAFGSFKESLMKNQALDATDVWLKALNTGVAPFASESLGHIATTPQVAYALEQVEATVRAALETNESQTKMVYKELYKLYGEAESIVTVQSLIDAGLDTATAQATHDMLFKLEQGADKRSSYLARFAALGLAHPVINQVLQAATAKESRKARDGKTFMERLEIVFENIMKMFRTYVTHTYQGQPANDKLLSLVGQLVDIEAKYQRKIAAKANTSNVLEPIEAKLKVFVEATGAKIEAVAGSNFIRNNRYTAVKVAGGLVGTVAGGRADLFMEGLFRLRAETFKKRFGVVASLAQAYVGQNVVFQGLLRMTKLLEHDRQKEVAGWAKTTLEAYADGGKMLRGKAKDNVAARASITSVFMRTGVHNLMGDFDMAGIEQLVTSKAALDTAITSFENQLAVHGKVANDYMNYAEALGYMKATGVAVSKFVHQNAYGIARMAGTPYQSKVSETQAQQAEATLKVLVTLYALRYSNDIAVGHAARVIKAENARADKMNGLEMTLLLQKRLETESLERLFGNNPMLMVHGYTSEIYDPNVTIKTANVLEGKALLEQGYVKRAEVPRDPADDDQDVKHLYVLQDGGVPRFVSGAMSNRGMRAKGTTIHNGYTNAYNATGIANASQNATLMQDRQATFADMARPGAVKALIKQGKSYLVPVFNEAGNVTNWRYMMAESTKDNVLNRNNRFDKVLGTIAGSIYDKETSREQNMTVVKALHDQFKTDYQSNPKSYIHIGPKSEDPEMKEIWNLLPEDTRKDIHEVWGHNGMTVKVENLDIVFGYRKLSVGTIFTKANEERDARKLAGQRTEVMALKTIDAWQKLIVMLFEFPLVGTGLKQGMTMEEAKKYARKAGANAVRTEHIWQAIVSEAKDIIVVKSGVVLLGNMSSNIWLLGMSGVPILDVMHHHLVAWKGAVSWKKDTEELEHLKRLRATGYTQGNKADIDRRILRLEDALDRNPVKELVEAGLMPTIVEDIDPEDDLYSYKSHLVRKVEGYTDKMNPTVVKAARTAYLAHDTPIYQAMSQMTRLSDFMARYTMYQHLISKKEPLSKQEATQKVSEAFINYDIALHRSIQYTDDMGITMFTKYFIGIQKVLLDTMRENPARVLTGVLLSKFLGLGPTVLDGSMWNHIGNNPLRSGPFELLDALGELPMINAPLALFNMGSSPAP